jgi:hypothetical protein
MKIESHGIRLEFSDLATILEGSGEYTRDDGFMQRSIDIARQAIAANSDQVAERIVESDKRFPLVEGLLEKLSVLHEASRDELSRMLHVLSMRSDIFTHPRADDAVFSFEHAPALMEYVYERLNVLEEAQIIARQDIRDFPADAIKHKIAIRNYSSAHWEEKQYQTFLRALQNLVGPVDIPDEH